jgi:uncharacterized protein (TIGR00369 family)
MTAGAGKNTSRLPFHTFSSGNVSANKGGVMMNIETHKNTSAALCGTPVKIGEGYSLVSLVTTGEMGVDDFGLVHGGFVFGLADYAAMIAVNHPNVALGGANVRFLKPVRVGDTLMAEARMVKKEGRKQEVGVRVARDGENVFEGSFVCFSLEKHVLEK